MFFLFSAFEFDDASDIAAKVKQAAGDDAAFEALAKDFAGHNKFVASQVTGRFITESDDEWSVVLLAFYEAVKGYRPDKGSFTSFADMVIKRRLIDHIRSRSKTSKELAEDFASAESGADEEGRYSAAAMAMYDEASDASAREEESRDIKSEISALDKELASYDIRFSDLPDVSPKADKTRSACAAAIMEIAGDRELLGEMKRKSRLPAKEISKRCGIPLKLLDNHRKYIIAVTLILTGSYQSLQGFASGIKKQAAANK